MIYRWRNGGYPMKKYLPLAASLASATLFGLALLFIKQGMAVVNQDTIKFLAFRFTTGFVVMTLLLLFKVQKVDYAGKPIGLLLLCGLLNPLISQILETTSTSYAPTSLIACVSSITPILVVVLSVLIKKDPLPSKMQMAFMGVTVLGVFVVNFVGRDLSGATGIGMALIFAAVVTIAFNRTFVRRAGRHFTSFETVYLTTGMGALGFSIETVIMHAMRGDLPHFFDGLWNKDFIISVLYMGIGSCVLAFLFMTYSLAHLPIAISTSTSTVSTVISILAGVLILHEPFRWVDVAGVALILGGVFGLSYCYSKESAPAAPAPEEEAQS